MNKEPLTNTATDRELVFERVLNAPIHLVWEVWTQPQHLAEWWGPNGFSLTTDEIEVKAGGIWKFVMHGPDGRNYLNEIQYVEVDQPTRLVYSQKGDEDTEWISFRVMVTFEAQDDKTRMTKRMVFPSAEVLQRVAEEYGAIEGAEQTLARLEVLLKDLQ